MSSSRLLVLIVAAAACGSPRARSDGDSGLGDSVSCLLQCSADLHAVVDCHGDVVTQCENADACDANSVTCTDACGAAESNKRSVGCDYFATRMDRIALKKDLCFAAFVANTWTAPAHVRVRYQGAELPTADFVRIPIGSGPALTYGPYDSAGGLAPGEVGVVFLAGLPGDAPNCPVVPAVADAGRLGTGITDSFEILTDVPVVAYQVNPYGGGSAAVTGASLLLPTSVWDGRYVAVNAGPQAGISGDRPSLNIIAREDTVVTITPTNAIEGGDGVPSTAPGGTAQITLKPGQNVQITQVDELTGSAISADRPIGVMAGHPCMNMPVNDPYCDHAEQMVPPLHALGSRHVGVMYRPRNASETKTMWRIIGTVDDTVLTYSVNAHGPTSLTKGQSVIFETGDPFVVTSQDSNHPFLLFTYMTGSDHIFRGGSGYGDPDFVIGVPPEQYLSQYVFFADPTYPETNVVVVRQRGTDGQFHDIKLDCAGSLIDWQPITDEFEFTRVNLTTGDFQNVGSCSSGRHEISSEAPFGFWVWGWGTPETTTFTKNVSYGYPGGMDVKPINDVILRR